MQARHVLTRDVLTIPLGASTREAARLRTDRRISALPVVDDAGRLQGVISEGDLMLRSEFGPERPRSWWLSLFSTSDTMASEFVKAHARSVADVMTRDVISVEEDTPLADVARPLERSAGPPSELQSLIRIS